MTAKAGREIKIGGVGVRPKWDWTDDYLTDVRSQASELSGRPMSAQGQREEDQRKFDQYVEFLASSRGITTEEARSLAEARIAEQRSASQVDP